MQQRTSLVNSFTNTQEECSLKEVLVRVRYSQLTTTILHHIYVYLYAHIMLLPPGFSAEYPVTRQCSREIQFIMNSHILMTDVSTLFGSMSMLSLWTNQPDKMWFWGTRNVLFDLSRDENTKSCYFRFIIYIFICVSFIQDLYEKVHSSYS